MIIPIYEGHLYVYVIIGPGKQTLTKIIGLSGIFIFLFFKPYMVSLQPKRWKISFRMIYDLK